MRVVLFFLFIATGCSTVAKKIYGIKNPEVENRRSLSKYASSVGIDSSTVCTVDTAFFLTTMVRIGSSMPEAELFTAAGTNLAYKKENQDCNAGLFSFIPGLNRDSVYLKKDNYTLLKHLAGLRTLDGNLLPDITEPGVDFLSFYLLG